MALQEGSVRPVFGMIWAKRFDIRRFVQALLIGLIVAGLMLSQVAAAPYSPNPPTFVRPGQKQVEPSPTGRYFIFFDGQSALQSTKANKGQIQSASVQNQVAGVRAAQVQQLRTIEKLIGRKLPERKHFDLILNAVAVPLSLEEAELIAALPGVKGVQPVRMLELATDAGPTWVGAPLVWDDSTLATSSTSMGEGVVIGMLDTGINFDHPSFASDPDISGDTSGYVFPKQVHNLGVCDDPTSQFFGKCNDKLIGAYSMTRENTIPFNNSPEDNNGHGSHTASIAAGNRGVQVSYAGSTQTINGMAPHAQLIAYDVCLSILCDEDVIIAAVQQSILDGVDVISYSISGGFDPYLAGTVEKAFEDAFGIGIFIAAAAGNEKYEFPTVGLVNHLEPWVSSVAATTHDRKFQPERVLNLDWGDIRGGFSLQGPANGFELLKPDLAAPGVNILAAYMDNSPDQDHYANVVEMSGTSMATPFVAGAAALLISAHPDWTPAEVKSALMLTAKTIGLFKDAYGTPADPFDIGSGRIQVDSAIKSGLVMDETAANMAAADPALGGDPKTLNLPSMQNNSCFKQCSWTRVVESVSAEPVTYTISSPTWIKVEPSQFTIAPGASQSLRITAKEISAPTQKYSFAQIDIVPTGPTNLPSLHLTAAVLFTPVTYYYFPIIGK